MNSVNARGLFLPVFCLFMGGIGPVFPQAPASAFARGEEFFVQDKPEEALGYLEAAVAEDPAHVQAFLYLGIVYQQLGRPDDAISAYLRILPRAGAESARVAFNLGNVYYGTGNAESAARYFSQAIAIDPAMSSAWLNRANSLVKAGVPKDAVEDYEHYLLIEPHTPQRDEIERIIAFIRGELAAEERRTINAGDSARIELERRRRLTEQVSSSLQSAAEDSRGYSARAGNMQGRESEFE